MPRNRGKSAQAEKSTRAQEIARLAAAKREEIAEEQAPAAQRSTVHAGNGTIIREPLAVPDLKRGGYRRSDPLIRMHGKDDSMVTQLHLAAANRFSTDYELGYEGCRSGGDPGARVDGGGSVGPQDAALAAMDRYRGACDAMGPSMRTPVQMVVLHRQSVGFVARVLGMSDERASGYLVAGLDLLADHYWPDRRTRVSLARELAGIVDREVTDIPQDRLGRHSVVAVR